MSRAVKEMVISDVRKRIGDARDIVVVDTSKLEAFAQNTLRLKLQEKGIRVLGVKNTLAKKILGEMGVAGCEAQFSGPSSLVWGGADIVELTKEIASVVKTNEKLVVKGGVVEGTAVTAKQVEDISKGPTRQELIGKIVQLMLSPGANLAGALLGPGGTLVGQLKSVGEEKADEAAAPAAG